MIRVQREDFDVGRELDKLAAGDHSVGGVASFNGLVRDMGGVYARQGINRETTRLSATRIGLREEGMGV